MNASQNISQHPRDNRNARVSEVVFLEATKAIDAPERNTNVGAQKCVTHRVKKTGILLRMGQRDRRCEHPHGRNREHGQAP